MSSSAGQLPTPQMTVYAATKVKYDLYCSVRLPCVVWPGATPATEFLNLLFNQQSPTEKRKLHFPLVDML